MGACALQEGCAPPCPREWHSPMVAPWGVGGSLSVRSLIRVTLVVAMGLGVSACDKCGNWFKYDAPKACGTQPVGQ